MVKMTIDNVKRYILEFVAFGNEPLHIIYGTLVDYKICENLDRATVSILQLLQEGYIECCHHSGWAGDGYKKYENLSKEDLYEYINIHKPQRFKEYPNPEEGGEYYFTITEKGRLLIPDIFA